MTAETSRSPASVSARARPRQAGDAGQTTILIIGFVLVIAMMVVVVVDASSAYLRRQSLGTLADGAALAAADGIAGEQVYTEGLGERPVVDPELARTLAATHLSAMGAGVRYPGLEHRVETDGERVVVHLGAPLRLPLPIPGVAEEMHVTGTAAAVVVVAE